MATDRSKRNPASSNSNIAGTPSSDLLPEHIRDIAKLSPNALRLKYETTYSTWRNMKRRRANGMEIAPEFEKFAGFLREVGPRPNAEATLDRIDFNDPLYGLGRVRWLDKRGQANNRSTTIHLTDSNGECHPLAEWARLTNQRQDTLRHRKAQGWDDDQVIYGRKRNVKGPANPWLTRPWNMLYTAAKAAKWEGHYQQYGQSEECPINFFLRTLEQTRQQWIDRQIALSEEDDSNQVLEQIARLAGAVEQALENLQYASKLKEQMARDVARFKLKKPEGWSGPKRFQSTHPKRAREFK